MSYVAHSGPTGYYDPSVGPTGYGFWTYPNYLRYAPFTDSTTDTSKLIDKARELSLTRQIALAEGANQPDRDKTGARDEIVLLDELKNKLIELKGVEAEFDKYEGLRDAAEKHCIILDAAVSNLRNELDELRRQS